MIRGIQTLVQKGLLNFIVANCSSPTPPPTSRSCIHVIIIFLGLLPCTGSLDEKMDSPSNLLMCKRVQSKRKICAKVVNAKFAHPFAPLCKWLSTFGIYHLLPLVRTLLHVSKFKANSLFCPVNSTCKECTLGTSSSCAW